jgi:hypothetical protein
MITKELLLQIFNAGYFWDIFDILNSHSKIHFDNMYSIYKESISLSYDVNTNNFDYFTIGGNLTVFLLLLQAKYQLNIVLIDEVYRLSQMQKQSKTNSNQFISECEDILSYYNIHIPLFNVIQLLYAFKNQLYNNDTFNLIFQEKIADYIINLISDDNLPLEVINMIHSLIT